MSFLKINLIGWAYGIYCKSHGVYIINSFNDNLPGGFATKNLGLRPGDNYKFSFEIFQFMKKVFYKGCDVSFYKMIV